jgi:hypothetical protein
MISRREALLYSLGWAYVDTWSDAAPGGDEILFLQYNTEPIVDSTGNGWTLTYDYAPVTTDGALIARPYLTSNYAAFVSDAGDPGSVVATPGLRLETMRFTIEGYFHRCGATDDGGDWEFGSDVSFATEDFSHSFTAQLSIAWASWFGSSMVRVIPTISGDYYQNISTPTIEFEFTPGAMTHIRAEFDEGALVVYVDGAVVYSEAAYFAYLEGDTGVPYPPPSPMYAYYANLLQFNGDEREAYMDDTLVRRGVLGEEYTPTERPFECPITGWIEVAFLQTDDAGTDHHLGAGANGVCQSRDGTVTVVGCEGAAAAYVFNASGQVQKLVPIDSTPLFGHAVAISGDKSTIAVLSSNQGAYVFVWDEEEGEYVHQQKVTFTGAQFGTGYDWVSLDEVGDMLAASIPSDWDGTGSVFVARRVSGVYSQIDGGAGLYDPAFTVNAHGWAHAWNQAGTRLIATGPGGDGSFYVWDWGGGTTWTLTERVDFDLGSGKNPGTSLSVSDNGLSAIFGCSGASGTKAVIYDDASGFTKTAELDIGNPHSSVAMRGDGLEVIVSGISGFVEARAWTKTGGSWPGIPTQVFDCDHVDATDLFGSSAWLAKDGGHYAATAPLDDTAATDAGSLILFEKAD